MVSLGNFEGRKPQKVGVSGWTRCPRSWVLGRVPQDKAHSWFRGSATQTTRIFGPFWAVYGLFVGQLVKLEVTKGLFGTGKTRRPQHMPSVFCGFLTLVGF